MQLAIPTLLLCFLGIVFSGKAKEPPYTAIFASFDNVKSDINSIPFQDSCTKIYYVNKCSLPPLIDGVENDAAWKNAAVLSDIRLHWENQPGQATTFRALYDQTFLYFIFEATDIHPVVWQQTETEMDVVWEDRVELFFGCDRGFKKYFCFEIDPLGRYLDNSGSLGQKIEPAWQCAGCKFTGRQSSEKYIVEGTIPLSTLQEMGVYMPGKPMITGVYRADFISTGEPKAPEMHWMSWVKAASPTPNFHIPSSTGCFVFEP